MNLFRIFILGLLVFVFIFEHAAIDEFITANKVRWLYIMLSSLLLTFLAVPVMKSLAEFFNVYDIPDYRKLHEKPTPLFGGVAIYMAFVIVVLINFDFSLQLKGIIIGSTIIAAAGVLEDTFGLSAKMRLLSQILAVLVLIGYDVRLHIGPESRWIFLLESILTLIWVVGITNAFNFFDGMDGLATGLAGIASFFIGVVVLQTNQHYVMYLAFAIVGCCLGFLPHNFHIRTHKSADIFLGDTGSTLLGFLLASMPVMADWATDNPIKAYSIPLLILGVLVFDMTYTTVERFASGKVKSVREWLEYVGRDHFHHRLSDHGLGDFNAVLFIYFLSATLGISALVLKNASVFDCLLLLAQAGSIYILLVILMLNSKRKL